SSDENSPGDYIPSPGFIFDFHELKRLVVLHVIDKLDHKLLLSRDTLAHHPGMYTAENLVTWEAEPTAENMLIYFRDAIQKHLPEKTILSALRLYETKDSYAEWIHSR